MTRLNNWIWGPLCAFCFPGSIPSTVVAFLKFGKVTMRCLWGILFEIFGWHCGMFNFLFHKVLGSMCHWSYHKTLVQYLCSVLNRVLEVSLCRWLSLCALIQCKHVIYHVFYGTLMAWSSSNFGIFLNSFDFLRKSWARTWSAVAWK